MTTTEHLLTRDNNGHWYVIPAARESEFDNWVTACEDDASCGDLTQPDYVVSVNGAPERVKFRNWRIG